MPYVLGQSFPRPFAGYTYPRKKRDYFPVASSVRTVYESITHDVTVSHLIERELILTRHIVDTVTVTDVISRIGFVYTISLAHDVTVSHTIKLNRIYYKSLVHSITASQEMEQQLNVTHTVTVTDEIIVNKIINRSLIDTVYVTHVPFITSPRVISLFDNVAVSDQIEPRLATFHFELFDDVFVTDLIQERIGTFHISLIDNVTVIDQVRVLGAIYTHSFTDTVTVSDKVNTIWNHHIQHDIAVTDVINAKRHITRSISTLDILSSDLKQDETFELFDNDVVFSQFSANLDIIRSFEDIAATSEELNATLFIPEPGPHPPVPGIPTAYGFLTVLETIYGTIILPLPELNDTQKNNDIVNVRRSMSGTLHAYIKKVYAQTLQYSFILDYPKALELKQWARTNFTETIKLTNFKGEIWQVKIVDDDLNLVNEGRYAGNPRQKTTVTLTFEGVKIGG